MAAAPSSPSACHSTRRLLYRSALSLSFKTPTMDLTLRTPFEQGNQNQTTTWADCIAWYEELAQRYPARAALRADRHVRHGRADPRRRGLQPTACSTAPPSRPPAARSSSTITASTRANRKASTPAWRWCATSATQPERLAALGRTVFLFIPLYNVDGSLNRNNSSRVNQDGPESVRLSRQQPPPGSEPRLRQVRYAHGPRLQPASSAAGIRR